MGKALLGIYILAIVWLIYEFITAPIINEDKEIIE